MNSSYKFATLSRSHGGLYGGGKIRLLSQGVQFWANDKCSKHLEDTLLCIRNQLGLRSCKQKVGTMNNV